jgi:hypothetical protein
MSWRAWLFVAALAPMAVGCGDPSESAPTGFDEPFRVSFVPVGTTRAVPAQFFRGPLPQGGNGPMIPNIANRQSAVFPGQLGKKIGGNAGLTATSVAFQFAGLGTGFWVVPTTIPDADLRGTILFEGQLDFARDLPPGKQSLVMVAADADGNFGPPNQTPLYFQASLPGGRVVASLSWDTNADLDLQIIGPDGKQLDAKHPTTATSREADGGYPSGTGYLDRDSNANCIFDGFRKENVVWPTSPTPGPYLAKVDMFSACGEAAANFVFKLYIDGEEIYSQAGRLLSIDADNGGPGLAITNFQLN